MNCECGGFERLLRFARNDNKMTNMNTLKRVATDTKTYPTKILQFGDGNFLRAFIDWMVQELNNKTDFNAGISVVKARPGTGKIGVLNNQDGLYTLLLNGIKNGEVVNENQIIDVIQKGILPYENYDEYIAEAANPELQFLVSNTTEAGIVFNPDDKLEDQPQTSFPGKVTAFLYERFKIFNGDTSKGLIFMPCELIDNNGSKLREIVLKYATLWNLEASFIEWIEKHNIFCNTLVDRIVSGYPKDSIESIEKDLGYTDPLLVAGEQYHLLVIDAPQIVQEKFPADKIGLNVVFTNDIKKYKTLKVRILNGSHTTLVSVAYLFGIDRVRESVENTTVGNFLQAALSEEICAILDFSDEELQSYSNDILDRFRNPSIEHELMSISLNSISKFKERVLPSILDYIEQKNALPSRLVFALASLITFYKGDRNGEAIALKDDPAILDFFANQWATNDIPALAKATLSNTDLWDTDLTQYEGLVARVTKNLEEIQSNGMEATLKSF